MKRRLFPYLSAIVLVTACGPSPEQLAKENAYKDSILKSIENDIKQKALREKAIQDSIKTAKEEIAAAIATVKVELQIAKDQLNSIKEFHLGRTKTEKESQLREQYTKIQTLEENIQHFEAQLKQ